MLRHLPVRVQAMTFQNLKAACWRLRWFLLWQLASMAVTTVIVALLTEHVRGLQDQTRKAQEDTRAAQEDAKQADRASLACSGEIEELKAHVAHMEKLHREQAWYLGTLQRTIDGFHDRDNCVVKCEAEVTANMRWHDGGAP